MFVLYPEDAAHVDALDRIMDLPGVYYGILHDRDVAEDGTLKKPHWHVVYKPPNPLTRTGLCKSLGLSLAYCEVCKSVRSSVRYNFHLDNPEKYQYNISQGFTSSPDSQKRYCSSPKSESDAVSYFINVIDIDSSCNMQKLIRLALSEGYYSEFRRNYSIIRDYLFLKEVK